MSPVAGCIIGFFSLESSLTPSPSQKEMTGMVCLIFGCLLLPTVGPHLRTRLARREGMGRTGRHVIYKSIRFVSLESPLSGIVFLAEMRLP